jgi:hypothetical protein
MVKKPTIRSLYEGLRVRPLALGPFPSRGSLSDEGISDVLVLVVRKGEGVERVGVSLEGKPLVADSPGLINTGERAVWTKRLVEIAWAPS